MIFEKHCPLPQAGLVVDMRSGRIGTDSEDLSGGSLLHAQIEPLDYSLLSDDNYYLLLQRISAILHLSFVFLSTYKGLVGL